ncbi:MAG: NYN domain-containing protein [Candidatus Heimdallarchaeota archaeon]|nr:NYN domain-containing protein [Candidatus Heimdallarchaeota archaeon]MCK4770850.1 NYN domain-containing protein [Candidatus Heimdallarchaeota archaeon]
MSERVMKILRRQTKRIFCLIDGIILEHISPANIEHLLEQIKQLGSIRKSIVFFDNQLAPEIYEMYLSRGFSPKIVPSDKDVYITLESLDIANSQQADIICIGAKDDSLLPVVIKLRETTDIMLINPTKTTAKRYLPYSDYIISLDEL